jgi:hypothetical protein
MPWQRTLAQVVNLTILIGNDVLVKRKNMARYHQDFNVEKSYDFDEEEEH